MISLERFIRGLVCRASLICGLISVFCFYNLGRLHEFGDHTDVSEDTMIPGGTPTFISKLITIDATSRVGDSLRNLGLDVAEYGSITFTSIPGLRSDGREGIVYVFLDDNNRSQSSLSGTEVGLSLAASLLREPWLSKDVFFVFLQQPTSGYEAHLMDWFEDWYRGGDMRRSNVPLIRAACVFDFTRSADYGIPYVVAEGINGQSTFEDYSNVLFEVARELNYPIDTVSVYDSIHDSMTDQRTRRLHHVFLNYGIPAFTFTRSTDASQILSQRVTLQSTAEVLGKFLRATSGLVHQLHHTSPFFLYSGPQKDISMGVYLPLAIGAVCPLFVAVIDRFVVTYHITSELYILGYAFAAPLLVGGGSLLATLNSMIHATPNLCMGESHESSLLPFHKSHGFIILFGLIHLILGMFLRETFRKSTAGGQLKSVGTDFVSIYVASVDKVYTVLSLAVLFLDFRIFLSVVPVIVTLTQTVRLFTSGRRSATDFVIGPIFLSYLVIGLTGNGHFPDVPGLSETLRFIDYSWVYGRKSSLASFADFWCSGTIAPMALHSLVYPLLLMALEVVVFMV